MVVGILSAGRQMLRSASTVYKNFVFERPYLSQAIQVSILMGAGDVIAQSAVEKTPLNEINWVRTAQFAGIGFVVVGPTLRVWYGYLDKTFKTQPIPWKKTAGKVVMDQLLFAPVFVASLTSAISLLQGMNLKDVQNRLKNNYTSIMLTNYTLWPAAQLINFALVPLHYQVLFVQCVAVLWNTYLSAKLGKHEK